jgi:hypothetical protein
MPKKQPKKIKNKIIKIMEITKVMNVTMVISIIKITSLTLITLVIKIILVMDLIFMCNVTVLYSIMDIMFITKVISLTLVIDMIFMIFIILITIIIFIICVMLRRNIMPRKPGSFGDAALSALSVNEEKEKLRNELKLKEEALKRKSRSVKEKFNTSRVSATMSVASTVFSALGVEMYTSLQSACKNPANIRRLNNSGSFDVLFDDDKKILLAVADFIRNRPDVQGEIMDFVDKYRKDLYAKTASVDDLNDNNEENNVE